MQGIALLDGKMGAYIIIIIIHLCLSCSISVTDQDLRMSINPVNVPAIASNIATAAEEEGPGMFANGQKESEETGNNDYVKEYSPPSAVNKNEKYLKRCEVLLIVAVILAIVGVLLLPTVFHGMWAVAQREVKASLTLISACARVTVLILFVCVCSFTTLEAANGILLILSLNNSNWLLRFRNSCLN